jgi:hypothetical protein
VREIIPEGVGDGDKFLPPNPTVHLNEPGLGAVHIVGNNGRSEHVTASDINDNAFTARSPNVNADGTVHHD